jgi:uncharacterized protein YjbJ (UPF0337 family)
MNWDQIAGNWKQLQGSIKEKWGKLTEDDMTVASGNRDKLAGILQQRYGYAKERVEKELNEFLKTCDSSCSTNKEEASSTSRN